MVYCKYEYLLGLKKSIEQIRTHKKILPTQNKDLKRQKDFINWAIRNNAIDESTMKLAKEILRMDLK